MNSGEPASHPGAVLLVRCPRRHAALIGAQLPRCAKLPVPGHRVEVVGIWIGAVLLDDENLAAQAQDVEDFASAEAAESVTGPAV